MQAAAAISDPVRRRLLELLCDRPMPAGELAGEFAISRPAISRHLRVLREAGLVHAELRGRERVYRIDAGPLRELDDWLGGFLPLWSQRLDALETEVARARRDRRRADESRDNESEERIA